MKNVEESLLDYKWRFSPFHVTAIIKFNFSQHLTSFRLTRTSMGAGIWTPATHAKVLGNSNVVVFLEKIDVFPNN